MTTNRSARHVSVLAAALLSFAWGGTPSALCANDPPDAAVNPETGVVETVDAPVGAGELSQVRHVSGNGMPKKVTILAPPARNNAPRIAISAGGEAWVVWWRSNQGLGRVVFRTRPAGEGPWADERPVGPPEEDGRFPSVAHDGSRGWIAYAVLQPAGAPAGSAAAVAIFGGDEPNPYPGGREILAFTASAEPEPQVTAEVGKLWVTWLDGPDRVGWCRRDAATGAWDAPGYETYDGTEGPDGARGRIRARLLAP
jgi:hypothetical protein